MRSILAAFVLLLMACDDSPARAVDEALAATQPDGTRQVCGSEAPADVEQLLPPVTLATGTVVEVSVVLACLDLETYSRPSAAHWIGVPTFDGPNSGYQFIREMTVTIDGESQLLSVSAYGDLLFTTGVDVEVVQSGADVLVRLSGGGTMGGWTATLRFEGWALVERYVTSSNFPDEAFERTEYGSPTGN